MDLLSFPGTSRVLARHREVLPQSDQLCGPFSTHVALHAVLAAPPGIAELAGAAGTAIWPADVARWRPPGAASRTEGWVGLARASAPERSGSDAAGMVAAVGGLTDVEVVPVAGSALGVDALRTLLTVLLEGTDVASGIGVVANVRTGPMRPGGAFDAGHFVVLWGCSDDGTHVGVADTYAELGDPGQPPGCGVVTVEALHAGLVDPPGRGLLLLADPQGAPSLRSRVQRLGVPSRLWST